MLSHCTKVQHTQLLYTITARRIVFALSFFLPNTIRHQVYIKLSKTQNIFMNIRDSDVHGSSWKPLIYLELFITTLREAKVGTTLDPVATWIQALAHRIIASSRHPPSLGSKTIVIIFTYSLSSLIRLSIMEILLNFQMFPF